MDANWPQLLITLSIVINNSDSLQWVDTSFYPLKTLSDLP